MWCDPLSLRRDGQSHPPKTYARGTLWRSTGKSRERIRKKMRRYHLFIKWKLVRDPKRRGRGPWKPLAEVSEDEYHPEKMIVAGGVFNTPEEAEHFANSQGW